LVSLVVKTSIIIARLLIRQPNILLLDEPTAAIDDVAEKQLIDHLKGWLAHEHWLWRPTAELFLELVDVLLS
jgi:ATP-binding cassette subfamily C protein LapB